MSKTHNQRRDDATQLRVLRRYLRRVDAALDAAHAALRLRRLLERKLRTGDDAR